MLEVRNLSYHYPKSVQLFQQINLTINPGEIVGIYGKSGTGKTTMAQVIAGYKRPQEGKVTIDGKIIPEHGLSPIQLIWQHPENVVNPRWKMKKILSEATMLSDPIIDHLGIQENWLNRYPHELSGGELQRFCIARALVPTTKYIIADEITTMLDAINQAQIWQALLQIVHTRNIGMLAISHDLSLLNKISDRVINFEKLSKQRILSL